MRTNEHVVRSGLASRRLRLSLAALAGILAAGCSSTLEPGIHGALAAPGKGAAAARGVAMGPNLSALRGRSEQAPLLPPVAGPEAPFAPALLPSPSLSPVVPLAGSQAEEGSSAHLSLLPGVSLPAPVKEKVVRIAESYHRRTGKELVITSGVRDALSQADAMYDLFKLGADVAGLYRNKGALREIQRAYEEGRAASRSEGSVVAAMGEVIRRQVESGVYISAHLRAGAVDVRNRDMSANEKRALLDSVLEVDGVSALEETKPPHYHLQVD
ncbi:hypothetical protein [Chondromyces crocatus]|nr:hypothetical protein [Chondromyces crocatus]